ncbi:MAG: DedA family protein [Proteiniphilum sp.]|nr:DedA family protein [Proteiniphilum sp.]
MLDGLAEYGLWGLLIASFLAATVLPFSSEVVLAALIAAGVDATQCIIFATIGNAAGGATCYYLGHLGKVEWIQKWFRIKPESLYKMQAWLQNKGAMMGFLSFVPAVGDVILVALGLMRANPTITLASMTIGKLLRYLIIGYTSNLIFT